VCCHVPGNTVLSVGNAVAAWTCGISVGASGRAAQPLDDGPTSCGCHRNLGPLSGLRAAARHDLVGSVKGPRDNSLCALAISVRWWMGVTLRLIMITGCRNGGSRSETRIGLNGHNGSVPFRTRSDGTPPHHGTGKTSTYRLFPDTAPGAETAEMT
jgi:hypothetical protein